MKKSYAILIRAMIIILSIQSMSFASEGLKQIKQAIEEKGAGWTAGENWITKLTPEERKRLCGVNPEIPDTSQANLLSFPLIENLPTQLDWRDNNGNWLTPIKQQGKCNSCWIFSAVAQVETWWKITNDNPDSLIDLSEQFVLSGSTCDCEYGGAVSTALNYIESTGIASESCFEYQANDQIPLSEACENWEDEAVKIPGWFYVTKNEAIIDFIKHAVYHQPVSTTFTVYGDFYAYRSGVYEHVWGDRISGHAVLIIGWNNAEQSWICKNSWGTDWGEEGYFRIKWDECNIGINATFILDDSTGNPEISLAAQEINLSLINGDQALKSIMISNSGFSQLEVSVQKYLRQTEFHRDSYMAWDDSSWWCGSQGTGAYIFDCLQYLETPLLDLSNTNDPQLSWMGLWDIRGPIDGCNVWISIDGGQTFNIASPSSPAYTCEHITSFDPLGTPGVEIPGWADSSGGWIPVDFDLSSFKSDSVVIRFAFVSNGEGGWIPDPLPSGFFVDEIQVSDGNEILFEDQGDENSAMRPIGYIISNEDWLDIPRESFELHPHQSTIMDVEINTAFINPGNYYYLLRITSNDSNVPVIEIPCNMEVLTPEYDISIEEKRLQFFDWPSYPKPYIALYTQINTSLEIENKGLNNAVDFDIVYTLLSRGQFYYSDTIYIPLIIPGHSKTVKVQTPFMQNTGVFDVRIKPHNFEQDYNVYNSDISSEFAVRSTLDNFTFETGFWELAGGWNISYEARNAMVNDYSNNMNATMIYKSPFYFQSGNPIIRYWAQYDTEQDKDICYLEVSTDSLNWLKIDSLSGSNSGSERVVQLAAFLNSNTWLRFHFISDSLNTGQGVFIGDLRILPGTSEISNEELIAEIPRSFRLMQNYPNPFNPKTIINYELPITNYVELSIHNVLGQKIETLVSRKQKAGFHTVEWDASNMASGVYYYRLVAGEWYDIKKMVMIK